MEHTGLAETGNVVIRVSPTLIEEGRKSGNLEFPLAQGKLPSRDLAAICS